MDRLAARILPASPGSNHGLAWRGLELPQCTLFSKSKTITMLLINTPTTLSDAPDDKQPGGGRETCPTSQRRKHQYVKKERRLDYGVFWRPWDRV